MAMSRQNIVINRSAEPQYTERQFNEFIFANKSVRRIRILMSPIGRFRERAFPLHDCVAAKQRNHCFLKVMINRGVIKQSATASGQNDLATVGSQRIEHACRHSWTFS